MFYLQDTNIAFGDQPIDSEHRKDNNQNKIDPGIFIAREFLSLEPYHQTLTTWLLVINVYILAENKRILQASNVFKMQMYNLSQIKMC